MTPRWPVLGMFLAVAALAALGAAAPAGAATQCDTDPNAVPFEATVDPDTLNALLTRLGNQTARPPDRTLRLEGICVDHTVPVSVGTLNIPLGDAPFTVTPSRGSLQVDLDLTGPFGVSVDGGRYRAENCDSSCRVELPYVGEVLDLCDVESGIVRPVISLFDASVTWDDILVTQVADTCVLGDCTAVHPLESTQVSLPGFDVDATGFGSCNVCLDFPDPLPDPPCFNPCAGFDPLIEDLIQPVIEDAVRGVFVNRQGEGVLIEVFSRQIVKDFGCVDIPEVKECKDNQPVAGLIRAPRDFGLNAVFYSLPLALAGVLAFRLRRRGAPPTDAPR